MFDRPLDGDGSSDFLGDELPVFGLAERAGLPRAYATGIDLEQDPRLRDEACGVGEPGT